MIDLHCHILPAIDDGPQTLEQSLELARAMVADGTTTVAATPHLRSDHPRVVLDELLDRCDELRRALAAARISLEVVAAAEVDALWALRASREELARASYGGTGSDLLLETPYGPLPPGFDALIADLAEDGFRILLAHPERAQAFQRDPDAIRRLAADGVLIQVTAASLALDAGHSNSARLARALVADGTAHVISSDLHGSGAVTRAPLSAGVAAAREEAPHRADWMVTDAPAAVLAGKPLPPPPEPEPEPRRGLRARLRRGSR